MTSASGREPVVDPSCGAGGESAHALAAALAAGDLDAAERAAGVLGSLAALDASVRRSLGNLNLKFRRWARAVEVFESIDPGECDVERPCRLAQNLAAMEECRPGAYRVLTTLDHPTTVCQPAKSPRGQDTIAQRTSDGRLLSLTPGGEPSEATARIVEAFADDLERGGCLALCGIGDGYVLTHLADRSPQLPLGREQCVHIIEPQPEVLLVALMIHDWSGPNGPIRGRRFQWWVGEGWADEMHSALENDNYLPCPERPLLLGMMSEAIDEGVREIIAALHESEQRLARRVARRYANRTAEHLAPLFGDDPPRQPRVLLLTTRFSTVLQHSTRDLARAFEKAGWATRVPIEPSPHHAYLRRNLLRHLADFEPDLIVQIDHLRHEHDDLFPPQIPFVCWIQDDLPNLTSRKAGAAVQSRDFVLTSAPQIYVNDYGYPARQCITFAKRTRMHDGGPGGGVDWLHDLAFVSNASQSPEEMTERLIEDFSEGGEALKQVVAATCTRIVRQYEQGQGFEVVSQVQAIIEDESRRIGSVWRQPDISGLLAMRLFASLNNALYRQQTLRWAVEAAEDRGLNLGLYGAGWERHPEFAAYARGPVEYGAALEDLTRRTRINMQIVPYSCVHQRLLDGIAAGGFFLIREHPVDRLTLQFNAIMRQALEHGHEPESVDELREVLDESQRAALDAWLKRRDQYVDHRGTDPVSNHVRARRERRAHLYEVLPNFDEVTFRSREELAQRISAYIDDDAARARLVGAQRSFVEAHYTYRGGVEQLTGVIADRLGEEASIAPAPCGDEVAA